MYYDWLVTFPQFGLESLRTLSDSPDNECRYNEWYRLLDSSSRNISMNCMVINFFLPNYRRYYVALSYRKLSPNLSSQRSIKYAGGFKVLFNLLLVSLIKRSTWVMHVLSVYLWMTTRYNLQRRNFMYVCMSGGRLQDSKACSWSSSRSLCTPRTQGSFTHLQDFCSIIIIIIAYFFVCILLLKLLKCNGNRNNFRKTVA